MNKQIVGLVLTACCSVSQADLIVGELRFDGQAPMAAVLYVRTPEASNDIVQIDQRNRQFSSFMTAASTGNNIVFQNSDSARHNLYANNFSSGTRFDVGLIPPGKNVSIPVTWPEDSIVRVGCAIHSHMETYIANIRSQYYVVLPFRSWQERVREDEYGSNTVYEMQQLNKAEFKIRSVPADKKDITLLAPYMAPLHFPLLLGEEKKLPVLRDGSKRGELWIRRSP